MTPIVELRNVTKEYRGIPAVKDVSFTLERGEVHALLGENGAGKSTLTKMIAGVVQPTAGEVLIDGAGVAFASPSEALGRGIAMVYQETSLVPSLTVAQNIYLTDQKRFHRLRGIYIAGQQFLQSLNFQVDPTAMVAALGAGQKQMVEIARAVHHNAQVIIFDEPTATLTPEEKHQFFSLVGRLKRRGVSIIFISHALEEALSIADRITVMRDGEHVVTDVTSAFDREKIVRAMVGRTLSGGYIGSHKDRKVRTAGDKVLSVQNLSMGNLVRNTSFSVFAGQITGVFGLIGSGRTEAAKVVSGVLKRDLFHGGQVRLNGRSVRYRVPRPAVRDGIIYVTEDRKLEGFFETMSIAENIHIAAMAGGRTKSPTVSMREMRTIAEEWIGLLNVKAINADAKVIELSGGNQQKVVVAKALVQKPKLVIFDEPTRGVDVGAIAEIHQLINRLADEGIAVMVISSYLPEVLQLSDRILVCRQGRIVEEFEGNKADDETIMYAAVH
ncbi:sugar ABC transporter ATP-binding protein [Aquibium carbonis]|uniref:Sugar ABC transporter ATP-binding protein n=1 Tax=Aquibium carbonis TaxID=2495581 RepID=A0A429YV41_9HYPH|nr:sugar ABC transporter ATP-binding protein [Aquibium carbonis]RST85345.1 sugar ABC transporter ATP-binding protein [Aquibium carbonis]